MAKIGKPIWFNPKGSHFGKYNSVDEPTPPKSTSIKLNANGAKPGDWIALQGNGNWFAPAYMQVMSGLFRSSSSTGYLKPGPSGQEHDNPFNNSAPPGEPAKVFDDFYIPYDKTVIVRTPKNAVEILLHTGDWMFKDNSPGPVCEVLLSLPNKKKAVPAFRSKPVNRSSSSSNLKIAVEHALEHEQELPNIPVAADNRISYPNATKFAKGPFADNSDPAIRPQWRGWYRKKGTTSEGVWAPTLSYWCADRGNGKRHRGWDLFAPHRSKVIVPVAPCYVQPLTMGDYGNAVAFRFSRNGKKYTAIYAHCDEFKGPAGLTNTIGGVIALTGCTGNSLGELCGTTLDEGGRTDHVHFGLYDNQNTDYIGDGPSGYPIDPATVFNWSMVPPTEVGRVAKRGTIKAKKANKKVAKAQKRKTPEKKQSRQIKKKKTGNRATKSRR